MVNNELEFEVRLYIHQLIRDFRARDNAKKKDLFLENNVDNIVVADGCVHVYKKDGTDASIPIKELEEYKVEDLIHLKGFLKDRKDKEYELDGRFPFSKQGTLNFWKQQKVRALLNIIKKWDGDGYLVDVVGSVTCRECDVGVPLPDLDGAHEHVFNKFPHGKDCSRKE